MRERSDWSPGGRTIADWAQNLLPLDQVRPPAIGAQPPLANIMSVPQQPQPPANPLMQGMMAANPSMVGPGRTHQDIANQSPGIPYGYAQAGVNPGFGGAQPPSQPDVSATPGMDARYAAAQQARRLQTARNQMMGDNMRASGPDPNRPLSSAVAGVAQQQGGGPFVGTGIPGTLPAVPGPRTAERIGEGFTDRAHGGQGDMTREEYFALNRARRQDLASGQATYLGPVTGGFGERNLSTTELLRQKAEDNPESPEANMLTRMQDRFAEKQAAKTPLALRHAMRIAKAQGRPLTPLGAMLEQAVAGGDDLTPDQRMAAGGGQYAAAMQQFDPGVMDTQGAWGTRQAFATNEGPGAAMDQGNMMRNLMPPGMGGAQQQLPTEGPLAGLTPEQSTMVQQYSEAGEVEALERYLRFQNVPPEQIGEILQVASGRYAPSAKFRLKPGPMEQTGPPVIRLPDPRGLGVGYGQASSYSGLLQ